ncbi:4'-phosphopantetheinyl transferase family protein [Ferruginibacter albus]|uniref:4'-phosphopantetheinyl transferase family protein n=1 Tax=Ferruginibacter albus TaxID=2875540 RepID=UPI001CC676CF|nr:4'-phosphopantetheinyl transferase superfamily protein [Ferruginibacter albus]UAY51339.1 4'-phosphopantetheinyl transferase superfamily protein [Ferruginibacter albus]
MPLVYQQNINDTTKLGIWHIAETEDFFLEQVPLQREISHWHKRLQHLAGRSLLKQLYPDFPYDLIRIADTRKPFLENEAYHFSISHCGDYAAVIVSKEERVGVDIELFNDKIGRIKDKFLSIEEQRLIEKIVNAQYSTLNIQLLCWSIKEAVYKWYGDGGVDFKEHIQITDILLDNKRGTAICRFLKNTDEQLKVQFVLFDEYSLSWLVQRF